MFVGANAGRGLGGTSERPGTQSNSILTFMHAFWSPRKAILVAARRKKNPSPRPRLCWREFANFKIRSRVLINQNIFGSAATVRDTPLQAKNAGPLSPP